MKPHVICLMVSSVDGRTLPSRWRPKGAAGNYFESVHDELGGGAMLLRYRIQNVAEKGS